LVQYVVPTILFVEFVEFREIGVNLHNGKKLCILSLKLNKMSNNYIDWLEKSIAHEHIKYYEYLDFKNMQEIGKGSFVIVYRAT